MALEEGPGYSVETVDLDVKDGLQCSECHLILRDAVQTSEGIRLCQTCFDVISKLPDCRSPKTNICVNDEEHNKPSCYPDKAVRREVKSLKIFCKNKKFGCEWTGVLNKFFETHKDECKYVPVDCPNKDKGCTEKLPEAAQEQHLKDDCQFRVIRCEYCQEETTLQELEGHHKVCSGFPIECSLCSQTVQRDQMTGHQELACPKISCICGKIVERKGEGEASASKHLGSQSAMLLHFISIMTFTKTILDNMQDMQNRITKLEMKEASPHPLQMEFPAVSGKELEIVIKELNERIRPLELIQGDWNSEKARLDSINHKFRGNLEEMDRKSKQQDVQIRTLKTQLEQASMAASWEMDGHMSSSKVGGHSGDKLVVLEKKYEQLEMQAASLKVQVSELELQLQASVASTHNGAFLWRIPGIPRRRREAIEERVTSIYSPPFYTGRNGYKMCVRAYLNGDGMGCKTHLSLFFVVMKGEFDALLKWPFEYKVSLILVDQTHRKHIVQTFKPTPESNSFQRPVSDMNVASGCPTFSKLNALEDPNYVKDDVIFIKCIVDTSRIFHP